MLEKLVYSLIDSFHSVMPITLLVMVISLIIGIDINTIIAFSISAILLIFGVSLFTVGADMSMVTIGESIGKTLVKKGNKWLILIITFIIGTVITIAEPDLMVLAEQLTSIPNILIIAGVGLGVGLFLLIAVLRIFKNIPFKKIVTITLMLVFGLLIFTRSDFITIAFDAGGVTTGALGVPLIVAMGYGLTSVRSDKNAKNDTFGLCGLASLGPIVIILILGLFFKTTNTYDTSNFLNEVSLIENYSTSIVNSIQEVCTSLAPILLVFIIFQLFTKSIKGNDILKISVGLVYTVLGLTLFIAGVNVGFLKMGYLLGNIIALSNYKYLLIPLGMIFGYIIVNAEPAVKILNMQISDLTEGSISTKLINRCLSIGVCLAVGISLLRLYFNIPIIYFLVPGYTIACLLTYFSPKVFSTIAFDSSGVASGPLTTSFLLPICIGACVAFKGNILTDAFGIGALVSMTPLITIQILGIVYQNKVNKQVYEREYNEAIVEYAWEI